TTLISLCQPKLNVEVLAFNVAEVTKTCPKWVDACPVLAEYIRLLSGRKETKIPNPSVPLRFLSAGREWPHCGRAAEKGDEIPPPHSITSSARASSVGGMVMPSDLAVLILTTSSTLLACSAARSDGFEPLRIRST